MANEQGLTQHGNLDLRSRIVISMCAANVGADVSLLGQSINEGDNPVCHLQPPMHGVRSKSHVPRDWSAKWVVNFISS